MDYRITFKFEGKTGNRIVRAENAEDAMARFYRALKPEYVGRVRIVRIYNLLRDLM